ncbi:prepilin-type N-terminal cleavage/methylation domain-containing protein [Mucilaginibacter sp. 44-25]|uniref:PulJ/GspJ family protein n=1 Tax=Mucilaginibacter sp. 44-25 TaxID=1895794 RepID=UPI000967B216|nr:prepilin-type N-terminal cleavage/methylation domain-containing protein [Mucilaginibacter sp. 44-25]OJW17953.1 MAG: hypothetical protein BGO48_15330 [Mucilaginibacter sp. 44-25]
MKIKSLKAFTLTEMIVVMLITVVVLGMAYSVFQLVSKTYSNFNGKNGRVNDAERLEEWLRRDCLKASFIYLDHHMLILKNQRDSTRYIFGDSVILRDKGRVDTFGIKQQNLHAYFQHRAVDTLIRTPVDRFYFSIMLDNEEIPETVIKWYSAEQLMELTDAIDRHQ